MTRGKIQQRQLFLLSQQPNVTRPPRLAPHQLVGELGTWTLNFSVPSLHFSADN